MGINSEERYSDVSDEELTQLFCRGDEQAFEALVHRYRNVIFRLILRFIGDPGRAEDLAQEVFIRVFRNIEWFRPELRFTTWLYRIAINLAKNEIRDRRRKPLFPLLQLEAPGDSQIRELEIPDRPERRPDSIVEQSQILELSRRAVKALPDRYREVFVLREVEGLSYEAISSIIGRPIGTVRSRVNRARERFRGLMKKLEGQR